MNDELKIVLGKLGYTNPSYDSINDLAHKYYIRFKEHEKELPYWINLVEVMNFGYRGSGKNENGHSRFLYELFCYTYNGTHPVINSFINRFTYRKRFKSKSGENKITVNSTFSETGRHPDIYINQLEVYDSDETISVVFENKIDYADDRTRQMEDYIKGMYWDRNKGKEGCDSNCYAFYLIPDYASIKKDNDHDDLGRQSVDRENVLKKLIPDKNYILLSYKEDILPWLKNDLLFSLKEKYLIANVNLYIQYLENRFRLSEDINNVKLEILKNIYGMESLNIKELCIFQEALNKKLEEYINDFREKLEARKYNKVGNNNSLYAEYSKNKGTYEIFAILNLQDYKVDMNYGYTMKGTKDYINRGINNDEPYTTMIEILLYGLENLEKENFSLLK